MSSRGVRSSRAYRARHLPASGFPTLLRIYSSPGLQGLFHPCNAHGVAPFKAFPCRRSGWLITSPFPSWRYPCGLPREVAQSTSGGCSRRQSVPDTTRFTWSCARPMPSWAFPSSGFYLHAMGWCTPTPPLRCFVLRAILRVSGRISRSSLGDVRTLGELPAEHSFQDRP
jgi:hypothetical protein